MTAAFAVLASMTMPAAQAAPMCLGKRATIVGTSKGEVLGGTKRNGGPGTDDCDAENEIGCEV